MVASSLVLQEIRRQSSAASAGAEGASPSREPPLTRPGAAHILRQLGWNLRRHIFLEARKQNGHRDQLPRRRQRGSERPGHRFRQPGCSGGGEGGYLRRQRHRVDPVRPRLEDAEESMCHGDAGQAHAGFRVFSEEKGAPANDKEHVRRAGGSGECGGADVSECAERDHEYDVGWDDGGGGEGGPGGGVPAGGGGDDGPAGDAECVGLLSGTGEVLLRLRDTNVAFTMTHVKALLMDMVVGGTDTTSNTVEFALAEMMANPQILRKAQQELDAVVGKHNIMEESHIHSLPYLSAIMKETLRLHPALPLLVPHSPSSASTVSGFTIPEGSRVFVNVWAIHRDPDIWENPSEFRPERFLDGKWDYSGNDLHYFPFGSGRRICAGTAMAERMFMFSLGSLVHSFDWSLAGDRRKVDLEEKFGIVLKKRLPLVAIATPRLADAALYE
ncbi:7-ethoxycoumarin O-deethylase-like [Dorcoceras hygrometricum]|uniref:7-ethoxycoumarin O-deethylase-like n=1 Tax=Dorcoceras hygrometricum TaxID=472368 RepID=A0A2Z7A494_9LAMI|nr:7-ethoxycoumarin O-deethylase-like [Dorcoceras hygrometricum]